MRTRRTDRTPKKAAPRTRSAADWGPRFIAALARTANIKAAAKAARIGRTAVYERRDSDPEFKARMAEALDDACDDLEAEARRRAHDGLVRKKFDKGRPLIDPATRRQYVEREYSDTLLIFLLKAHRPEKYRDRLQLEHGGGLKLELVEEVYGGDATTDDPPAPGTDAVPPV